ncbi:MAG: hypothetical protein ACRDKT_08275 [Actinomycetota bacterium]
MDTAFITGMGAFLSAIIVFIGSAFLLMTLVMGARLAYFVTASITLCFVLIMAVVWSINPLGPLGEAPQWTTQAIGEDAEGLDFNQASSYPEDPWAPPDDEDDVQVVQASELESDAMKAVEGELTEGVEGLPSTATLQIAEDSTRLLQQREDQFGATLVDVLPPSEPPEFGIPSKAERERLSGQEATGAEELEPLGQLAVIMEYHPGNQLGPARMIALGTLILLVLHLVGLSLAERRGRRVRAEAEAAT